MKFFLKFIGVCGIVTGLFALFIYLCFTLKTWLGASSFHLDWIILGIASTFFFIMKFFLAKDNAIVSLIVEGLLYAVAGFIFGFDKVNDFICAYWKYAIIGTATLILLCVIIGYLFGKEEEKEESIIDDDKSDDTHITIREGITEIPSNVFKEMKHIVSVTIPDSVVKIADDAFMGCKSLREVVIPDSVTSIGANAFANCSSLKSIKLPASLTKIEEATFRYCFGLKEINIPESVSAIDKFAFEDCLYLDSIAIPASTTIDKTAFKGCVAIKSSAKATI